jgi:hypothetical protein
MCSWKVKEKSGCRSAALSAFDGESPVLASILKIFGSYSPLSVDHLASDSVVWLHDFDSKPAFRNSPTALHDHVSFDTTSPL